MQIDLSKTFALVRGGLIDHENTWNTYFVQSPDWKETATVLTGPLLLASVLLSMIFSRISGGFAYYAAGHGFVAGLILALFTAVVGVAVTSLVFNWLAGTFTGKPDFSRAFAAVSFSLVPAWVGGVVGALIPAIGMFVSLAGGIVGLVFLYQIMPLALGIPENKRVAHYVSSLVLTFVIQILLGLAIGKG